MTEHTSRAGPLERKDHGETGKRRAARVFQTDTGPVCTLKQLTDLISSDNFREDFLLGGGGRAIFFANHLYQPLIYFKAGDFKDLLEVSPVQLNRGERDFANVLRKYVLSEPDVLDGKEFGSPHLTFRDVFFRAIVRARGYGMEHRDGADQGRFHRNHDNP